jgi:hypothetical protein
VGNQEAAPRHPGFLLRSLTPRGLQGEVRPLVLRQNAAPLLELAA